MVQVWTSADKKNFCKLVKSALDTIETPAWDKYIAYKFNR